MKIKNGDTGKGENRKRARISTVQNPSDRSTFGYPGENYLRISSSSPLCLLYLPNYSL
jgi:hypothetical protein